MSKDINIDIDAEVTVKDIVTFYVKINDSSKAKKDIARLSAKDKATALDIIAKSAAGRDFRIEVARYFIYDLDAVVRKKAEHFMEDLVPDWVTDPAESILKLLKSTVKGSASRNAAVKFLFGIVDSTSLRDTFTTLLNGRNREHMSEILAIFDEYIDSSSDEHEQVKIFDACLDIVISDVIDHTIKHHASNLLSAFFNKVQATDLGKNLLKKCVEMQVDKAEGVYRYLCSGATGLNSAFLEDILRPLQDGDSSYQIKILSYLRSVMEKTKIQDEADAVLDTYPDYWNQEEPSKEEKIRKIRSRILSAADALWDSSENQQVRDIIIQIHFGEYRDKGELLEQLRSKLESGDATPSSREKLVMLLRCFIRSDQPELLKMQAVQLLLCAAGDPVSRLLTLEYLASCLEGANLNEAQRGSIATHVETLLAEKHLDSALRDKARYLLFIGEPQRLHGEEEQKALLNYLRGIAEGEGFASMRAEKRVLGSLAVFEEMVVSNEKLQKAAQYLAFKITTHKNRATWSAVNQDESGKSMKAGRCPGDFLKV